MDIQELNKIWINFVENNKQNQWFHKLKVNEDSFQYNYQIEGYIEPIKFIDEAEVVGFKVKEDEETKMQKTLLLFANKSNDALLFEISVEEANIFDYDIKEGTRSDECMSLLLGDIVPMNCFLIDFFVQIGENY